MLLSYFFLVADPEFVHGPANSSGRRALAASYERFVLKSVALQRNALITVKGP